METFSSEIGKKMRSAVKAKLIELGTGGTSGYVDEELPDYVMIMVANKRSKQQMTSDLNLFLGEQTELFVTWLHEVLQKLQEVTIPAPAAKKRKSGQKDDSTSKKDKKALKKDKKVVTKPVIETVTSSEKPAASTDNTATAVLPPSGSITDVFAEELLEKAKHNLDATAEAATHVKKSKTKKNGSVSIGDAKTTTVTRQSNNEFDIPTFTEIASNTSTDKNLVTSGNREKDLAELAEIQKKIYAAKKHLRDLGELKEVESDDEDFLKLRDEGSSDGLSDLNAGENANKPTTTTTTTATNKEKSPIVFDKPNEKLVEKSCTPPRMPRQKSPQPVSVSSTAVQKTNTRNTSLERKSMNQEKICEPPTRGRDRERREISPHNKRPVHARLGMKPQSNDRRIGRREKELYVPAHRRQESRNEKDRDRDRERWRSRERDDRRSERNQPEKSLEREVRSNYRESTRSDDEAENTRTTNRQRVGSTVVVAPSKPIESSDEEPIDKPVNSIIKIKPRPAVSPSRQACKNLLLRAVAEAQRSTILNKTTVKETAPISKVKSRLGKTISMDNEELFTKNLRERRLKRDSTGVAAASMLFKRQTQNFIIEVEGNIKSKRRRTNSQSSTHSDDINEPYKPEPITGPGLNVAYQPYIEDDYNYEKIDDEDYITDEVGINEVAVEKTQFVVTLNDNKTTQKYKRQTKMQRSRSISPQPQVSSSSAVSRNNNNEPTSTTTITTTQFNRSRPRDSRRSDIRNRLAKRPATPLSPTRAARLRERESVNSSPTSTNTPPRQTNTRRGAGGGGGAGGYVEVYRKTSDVKKIIIKNDTDEEELSSPRKQTPEKERKRLRVSEHERERATTERCSTTPPLPKTIKSNAESVTPPKSKHIQIKFDLERTEVVELTRSKSREVSAEREHEGDRERRESGEERRKISIRTEINNKYDNIPALSSVALDSAVMRVIKPKERCKYHPNCTKQFCDYYHPTAPCMAFPNCKYADKCNFSHPNCKYDMTCTNLDCNYSHSGVRNPSQLQPTAPPLSSHVVPVQNYKSITAATPAGASTAMCKYYPNCTKIGCTFYHPKPCRFGKNCINKLECKFYHHELQSSSKFKWVATA